jgi:hypothetical protein
MYWRVGLYLNASLISAPDGGKWSPSRPGHIIPGTYCMGGSVGPWTGLDFLPPPGIDPVSSVVQPMV